LSDFNILDISNDEFNEFYEKMTQLEGFLQEKIVNIETEYDINIEEHINNKELAKNQLQALLKHSVIPERVEQYNQQLEDIQAEIDNLHSMKILQQKYKNNTLVYVQIRKNIDKTTILLSTFKKFLIFTFGSLLILVMFVLVLFFIMDNLLKLMKVIGIRTSTGSKPYYYSPKKKKIKRKYRDNKEENNT
jgi:hypothetical protein